MRDCFREVEGEGYEGGGFACGFAGPVESGGERDDDDCGYYLQEYSRIYFVDVLRDIVQGGGEVSGLREGADADDAAGEAGCCLSDEAETEQYTQVFVVCCGCLCHCSVHCYVLLLVCGFCACRYKRGVALGALLKHTV